MYERKKKEKKLETFTYNRPQIRKITNLFKHTNIGIALRNKNTLQQLNPPPQKIKQNKTKAEFVNLHSTIAIDHTSDKQSVAYD